MLGSKPTKTVVLGVGNLLMRDEGVGVHVVNRLVQNYEIPEGVLVLDGGTLGLDLLYYLEGIEHLLMVDAVEMGGAPGSLLRLEDDDVPNFLSIRISPHEIGIPDMLFAAKLKGIYPPKVVLWGVQPERIEIGTDLSPTVTPEVDTLVFKIIEQLEQWGYTMVRSEVKAH